MSTLKIPTKQLIEELKEINPSFELVPNPNRPGLSNIKLNGVDVLPVPAEQMQEIHTPDYIYVFPNGMSGEMKTYTEAKEVCLKLLETLKDKDVAETFYATE